MSQSTAKRQWPLASPSPTSKSKLHLTVYNQQVPKEETPTHLGVKSHLKLTWNLHINGDEGYQTALAHEKTGWHQLGIQQQHPGTGLHRQCLPCDGIQTSSMGHNQQKQYTSRLAKVQSKDMCIITGELKTILTFAMETDTRLPSLDQHQEDCLYPQRKAQKSECPPSQPTSSGAHKKPG